MVNTREIVLDCVMEIMEKKQYSHQILKQVLDKYGFLEKRDRSFIQCVTQGTVERAIELDYIIDRFSKVKVKKMKPLIRSLMRMSVYQLMYMDKTLDAAVCNEAVKIAAKRGFQSLKGFVNGVLRAIVRNKAAIPYPDPEKQPVQSLSVRYSMPEWLIEKWMREITADDRGKLESLLEGLLEKRPLIIRMDENMEAAEKQELLSLYQKEHIKLETIPELAYAYIVKNPDRTDRLPGFADGKIMIQDAGSMEIIEYADIQPGWHVVDVCGAPGGKALHAAAKLFTGGSVSVRDLSEKKAALIDENIRRSGYTNITSKVWDATVPDESEVEKADLVIADLPCSGLGVIGRKPDIKYRITQEDVEEIAALQRKILSIVKAYVKPGGKLLYSTCTLTREENHDNAEWFSQNSGFTLVKEQQLLPQKDGLTDGFYMALFQKN